MCFLCGENEERARRREKKKLKASLTAILKTIKGKDSLEEIQDFIDSVAKTHNLNFDEWRKIEIENEEEFQYIKEDSIFFPSSYKGNSPWKVKP